MGNSHLGLTPRAQSHAGTCYWATLRLYGSIFGQYRYMWLGAWKLGTLPCVDFTDAIMGDIPIHNLTTLYLNRTLPCVDFMDVIMGDIPIHNLTTLRLNGTLSCRAYCWFHGCYHGRYTAFLHMFNTLQVKTPYLHRPESAECDSHPP